MIPQFNSLPYRPNQAQTNGTTTAPPAQQVAPSNHGQGNPKNSFPNSAQNQAQIGVINPQIPFPFNNSNTHLSNGPVAMPNRPMILAPMAMGAPNHNPLHLQNGMPLLGSTNVMMPQLVQCQGGFGPQNPNSMSMNPMNLIQPPNQFFAHNSVNMPQYLCQNAVLPNGQSCLQSPMQNNSHQFVQMPMPNYTQVGPCNMRMYPNQVSQSMAIQNPNFFANPQFGMVHSNAVVQPNNQNQQNLVLSSMDANAARQSHNNTSQQSQGNSPRQSAFGSVPQPPQNFTKSQGNFRKDGGINNSNNNWKNSQNTNFTKNLRKDASHKGFSKSQFHNMPNAKGKSRFHNKYGGTGYKNDGSRTCKLADSTNQTRVEHKGFISLNYTEQEIQQWREARKKNYPSKFNIEKKLAEKLTEPEVTDRDAKLRREQLKEVLAKQAQLGCEVAEIPSHYLSDSEKRVLGKEVDKKSRTKKERFQNKFNKRGRFHQNERFGRKQQSADDDPSNLADQDERFSKKQKLADNDLNKKQPTLLQRLLSADIRRDKSRLLQVFRFMVMNSFFKDWPEKSLRFPLVIVKDGVGEVVEEKSSSSGKGVSEAYIETSNQESERGDYRDDGGDKDEDDDNSDDEHDVQAKEAVCFASVKGSMGVEIEHEEEEGEIID
ncbi:hypothetical protein HYC85_016355 [Camellia sinensis]|uniref:FMR1-interacting protein 1 conserved domain-containing protein n=1 Tax=Camellia sinensis TaxID=4442 RepID=A0A7J7H0J4_CAMSI|nr:hypothetical protein HYC85_016355 [Camellia sinensis]